MKILGILTGGVVGITERLRKGLETYLRGTISNGSSSEVLGSLLYHSVGSNLVVLLLQVGASIRKDR